MTFAIDSPGDYDYWDKVAAPIITRITGIGFKKGSHLLDSFI